MFHFSGVVLLKTTILIPPKAISDCHTKLPAYQLNGMKTFDKSFIPLQLIANVSCDEKKIQFRIHALSTFVGSIIFEWIVFITQLVWLICNLLWTKKMEQHQFPSNYIVVKYVFVRTR